jgi:hypothetical protein
MPTVVNTELGSGLVKTRGLRFAEPEDVAAAIVGALKTGRVDVYVPREMSVLMRLAQVLPRSIVDFFTHLTRADRVLSAPDHVARAAYEARTSDAAAGEPEREPAPIT